MKRTFLKTGLHLLGGSFCLLSVVFVFVKLYKYIDQINLSRFDVVDWLLIILLAGVYGLANIFLALAWWDLLAVFGANVNRKWAVKVYGISQLAKYVPGNIFHLAGRQTLGMVAGVPANVLVKSAVWELGLIAAGGLLFGCLVVPLVWPAAPVSAAVLMFGLTAAGCIFLLHRLSYSSLSSAFFFQLIFLFISGGVFVGTLAIVSVSAVKFSLFPVLCGAYVIAWLVGFVTPGASAGVGVREMVLLFLLDSQIPVTDLLFAVVLGRIVTVAGDFFFFIGATTANQTRGKASPSA